ncbi:hypothetical protein Tco_0205888 [Tanacetum coccineum]
MNQLLTSLSSTKVQRIFQLLCAYFGFELTEKFVSDNVEEQTEQVLLADLKDFKKVNEIYAEYLVVWISDLGKCCGLCTPSAWDLLLTLLEGISCLNCCDFRLARLGHRWSMRCFAGTIVLRRCTRMAKKDLFCICHLALLSTLKADLGLHQLHSDYSKAAYQTKLHSNINGVLFTFFLSK